MADNPPEPKDDGLAKARHDADGACRGCDAAQAQGEPRCLTHADPQRRKELLSAWAKGQAALSAVAVVVDNDLLGEILAAAPADDKGHKQLRNINFTQATFGDSVRFWRATFGDRARFNGATFDDGAWFVGATFGDDAWFGRATFGDNAQLGGATFGDRAWFGRVTFGNKAQFEGATFGDRARFGRVTFGDNAQFEGATFGDRARFGRATFGDNAQFERATFGDDAWFKGATFGRNASLAGSSFGEGSSIGPLRALDTLILNGVKLHDCVVAVAAVEVHASRMRLSGACLLRISGADVDLSEADCSTPTILAPLSDHDVGQLPGDRSDIVAEPNWHHNIDDLPAEGPSEAVGAYRPPRLVSLRGADVAGLTCTDVDLSDCRFAGAHHLDSLRMEGASSFITPPGSEWWPLSQWRRWSRRGVLAEEAQWRAGELRGGRARWPGWHPPKSGLVGNEPVTAARLAGLYRALRKAREDAKDEPGAADFYYGEMEMRRHDADRPRAERAILHAYWAISGYGLRASRAFAMFAAVVILGALGLWNVGLEAAARPAVAGKPGGAAGPTASASPAPRRPAAAPTSAPSSAARGPAAAPTALASPARRPGGRATPSASPATDRPTVTNAGEAGSTSDRPVIRSISFVDVTLYALATATPIGASELGRPLTTAGEAIRIALRFIGPVLFGLALLALRGRVKR
jgi:hypothetical protein